MLDQQTLATEPDSASTATTYDALGGVLSTEDGAANITSYTYDGFHHLASETNPDGSAYETQYNYDAAGNLLSETDAQTSHNNTTTYAYDSLNRMTSQEELVALSSSETTTATTTYDYDDDGNLVKKTDPDGQVIDYAYDHLNRETGEKWYNSGDTQVNTITYGYNNDGELVSATESDSGAAYTYTYDGIGRLETTESYFGSGTPDVVLASGYDADGNQTSLSAKIGGTSGTKDFLNTYTYDALNRETEVTQASQGSGDGYNTVAPKEVLFKYDAVGDIQEIDVYDSTDGTSPAATSSYTYDDAGRTIGLTQTASDSGTVAAYSWTYYNKLNEVETYADSEHTPENTTYTYDADGQLTSADVAGTTTSYSYDHNGNLTGGGSDTIGDGNRLIYDGSTTYTYDASGNMLTATNGSGTITYTYDKDNRLIEVQNYNDTGHDVAYAYDMYGNMVSRTINISGTTTTAYYVYAGSERVLALSSATTVTDRLLNGPMVDQVLADEHSGSTEWLLGDNQGTIRNVLNSSGDVIDHLTYDAFGNLLPQSGSTQYGSTDVIFGEFDGSFYDNATGQQFHGAREYNSSIGRWDESDPTGLAAGPNTYEAFGNSPTNFVDPSGLASISIMFDAFIPKSKGTSILASPLPDVKWGVEPGQILNHIPYTNFDTNYFATDNREAPGSKGTYRLSSQTIAPIDASWIGHLTQHAPIFKTIAGDSNQIEAYSTAGGMKYEPGSLKTLRATPTQREKIRDISSTESEVTVEGWAGYPFDLLAPDIKYKIVVDLERSCGDDTVSAEVTGYHTRFPAFELLINNHLVYSAIPTDPGPDLENLNTYKSISPAASWVSQDGGY